MRGAVRFGTIKWGYDMKASIKRGLVVIGTIAGVLMVLIAILILRIKSETNAMTPLRTGLIADGVYAVKDSHVNMYIMKNGNYCIAIDAADDTKKVTRELSKARINPETVKAVFLTHTDSDHVAALKLFNKAAVYLSKPEERMINGTTSRMLVFHNKPIGAYQTLNDGQVVDAGPFRVRCIVTPGHTPGSACYLVNDAVLFTGDTLRLKNGRVELFNELFNMDSAAERKSWTKIMDLRGVKYIFTAHYGYTDNYQRAFEKLRGK